MDLSFLDTETIKSFVSGCCTGAIFAWSFAQRTIVRDVLNREESMKQRFVDKDKEFEEQVRKLESIYIARIGELNDQVNDLLIQIRDLQESRLQIAMSRNQEISNRTDHVSHSRTER